MFHITFYLLLFKKTLELEARNCQYLIIWTDGDREGENIGFEIIEVCKKGILNLSHFPTYFLLLILKNHVL